MLGEGLTPTTTHEIWVWEKACETTWITPIGGEYTVQVWELVSLDKAVPLGSR